MHLRTISDGYWDGFQYGFFPVKKLFFWSENLYKFRNICSKPTLCIHFKFDTGFFSCRSLIRLVNMAYLHTSLYVSLFLPVCTFITPANSTGNTSPNSKIKYKEKAWNLLKVNNRYVRATSMWGRSGVFLCQLWTDCTPCSRAFIANFKEVNNRWVCSDFCVCLAKFIKIAFLLYQKYRVFQCHSCLNKPAAKFTSLFKYIWSSVTTRH